MKKFLVIPLMFCAILALSGSTAHAMTATGPLEASVEGWYKDYFTVQIKHGALLCAGPGTAYTYTYKSTKSGTQAYSYAFYADNKDDPYLKIDGGQYQELDRKCTSSPNNGTQLKLQFSAKIDKESPYAAISTQSTSTGASSYTVKGTASDPEGTLKTVQAKVNGDLGPTATVQGTNFSVPVSLNRGSNTIQVIATDVVGHSYASNTITITNGSGSTVSSSNSSSSGSSGTTTGGGSGGSGSSRSGSSGSKSSSGSTASGTDIQSLKFDDPKLIVLTDPNAGSKASNPEDVQQKAAVAGATGLSLVVILAVVAILLGLCIYIFIRYRPDKPGLRRRIVVIMTLPSLVPLLGLGLLGYQQLSDSVKSQLSDQLQKAADASAVKLDREFAIRRSVITSTASNILQIKNQYKAQQDQLDQKKNTCGQLVNTAVPSGQFTKITGSPDCLPFLAPFAQLRSSVKVSDYLNALDQGASQAKTALSAQENQRVNEQLTSIRGLFEDILELAVVDNTKEATVKATLPREDAKAPTITQTHKDLLTNAATTDLALYEVKGSLKQLLLTYPIKNGDASIGGVVVAIDTQKSSFIPKIWQATPKSYATDQVYFETADGQLVTPASTDQKLLAQLKPLAKASVAKVYSIEKDGETYTVRTAAVGSVKWVVAVGTPASSVLAPIAGLQRTALLAIAGFILLSMFLGAWFANKIVGEIKYLYEGAMTFARGNLDHRIHLDSDDELRALGDTMNQMAADIKTAQTALIEKDKEFIHVASHELKAPMTVIIGYMSMIVEDGMSKLDKQTQEMFREVYNGTVRLRDLIIDLLDIARMESGHAEFKIEPVDVSAVAESIIAMQKLPAQQASVTLVHQVDAAPPKAMADSAKLQIVLTNFVTNAIKYNRKDGTVTVAHEVKDGQLVTSIADTGLGIPEDQQGHMFEKFYRVKHEDRASVPGTGLGMYITKQFIENMGGKIWFESVHGKGTTFFFSLPLERSPLGADSAVDLEKQAQSEPGS